ncbi:hypothetical protein F3Y22_tig00112925pilonHSYRG00214 [Hibiscus syriacus]|uniref:Uncharacterized protein n=1 Tax=Hibiscus syriacus TaxID=106335 RepID=A0A6A2WRK9_HIBSY|nr:hypothetical protein F3Y22_tig00112925pilonHSYRG00214 [Hibiscus syriacus]
MSSKYQILDNRPIDKWKNGEGNTGNEEDNGLNSDPQPINEGGIEKVTPVIVETIKTIVDHSDCEIKESGVKVQVDINESAASLGHEGIQERDIMMQEELIAQTTTFQTKITVTKDMVSELESEDTKARFKDEGSKPEVETEGPKAEVRNEEPKGQLECVSSKPQLDIEDSKVQPENDGSKAPHEDDMLGILPT